MSSEKQLLLNIARKFLITNSLAAQAEQGRRILQERIIATTTGFS